MISLLFSLRYRLFVVAVWGIIFAHVMPIMAGTTPTLHIMQGRILDDNNKPIAGATIALPMLKIGTISRANGHFTLTLPERFSSDSTVLQVSALGYKQWRATVAVQQSAPLVITLAPGATLTDEVVVSANRSSSFVQDAPTKIEVVTARDLLRTPALDITQSCEYVPGIKVQDNCGVCGTTDIRIQGLEGQYAQILINGMPVVSNLGMVYGLRGISPTMIKQIELIKGPSTILFGPEAVAGTMNIILKSPQELPLLQFASQVNSFQEHALAGTLRSNVSDNIATSFTVEYQGNQYRTDLNNDGFMDVPLYRRLSLMNAWTLSPGAWNMQIFGRYFYENRTGGQMAWQPKDRGGDVVYGENILTHRTEVFGTAETEISDQWKFQMRFSGIGHVQDSQYGIANYTAQQHIMYTDALAIYAPTPLHTLTLGTAYRAERYIDNTPATAEPITGKHIPVWYHVPSLFAQYDYAGSVVGAQIGLRYNHHNIQGSIVQPRAALKFNLAEETTLRLTGGTGFRTVNVFTEDHSALTGARRVVIAEQLRPEQSVSGAMSIMHEMDNVGGGVLRLTADAHWTRFSNKIIADYDADPNTILYKNLAPSDYALTRGFTMGAEYSFAFPLRTKLSWEVLNTYRVEQGEREEIWFNPRYRVFADVYYAIPAWQTEVQITGKITGAQRMPRITDDAGTVIRPLESPVWSIWNAQITKRFTGWEVFGGVENILNFTQASPLIAPEAPFSDRFETAYIWAPIRGRVFTIGVRVSVE